MSQRPRLAGDGRLVLPEAVTFDDQGFVRGRYSTTTIDPFDWTSERLLVAESFARLELADDVAVRAWLVANGALDPFDFTGGDAEAPADWHEGRPWGTFAESRNDEAVEQANVRWHLATLVRLGEHRVDKAWAADWSTFILAGPGKAFLLGGPTTGDEVWLDPRLALERQRDAGPQHRAAVKAQGALRSEVARRPIVTARASGWDSYFGAVTPKGPDLGYAGLAGFRDPTWDWTLALEQRLIDPYLAWALDGRHLKAPTPQPWTGGDIRVPTQAWEWRSVLAPIYLQLYEALRRISEGQPGAAVCRECGQPFLALDARRRFFCNDRERFRYAQRDRRRRLAGEASAAEQRIDVAFEVIEQDLAELERADNALRADQAQPDPWLRKPAPKRARRRRSPP